MEYVYVSAGTFSGPHYRIQHIKKKICEGHSKDKMAIINIEWGKKEARRERFGHSGICFSRWILQILQLVFFFFSLFTANASYYHYD